MKYMIRFAKREGDGGRQLKTLSAKMLSMLAAKGAAMLFLPLFLVFLSCSSIDCPVQNTVAVRYAVGYEDNTGTFVQETLADTMWVFTRRSDGTDTLVLNRGVGLKEFTLPVSYQHPEDMLVFLIADTAHIITVDTVWMKKDDIPHFESVDCSAHFFHNITAVRSTHYRIEDIVVKESSVTYNPSVQNLLIRFKKLTLNEI